MTPTTLTRAAISYAERLGWYVFPLAPRSKIPLKGTAGFKDATNDPREVERVFGELRDPNIGIACGPSGLAVPDIDPRNGGDDSWHDLVSTQHAPDTVTGLTGGGGLHLIYSGSAPSAVLADGVELKADGGYIVAPPSIHPNGRTYEWDCVRHPLRMPIAPLPEWISRRVGAKRTRTYAELTSPVDPSSFVLGAAFEAAGLLGPQIRNGVFAVKCPNERLHTTGRAYDTSTVIFAPQPGRLRGRFYCSHSHCQNSFR